MRFQCDKFLSPGAAFAVVAFLLGACTSELQSVPIGAPWTPEDVAWDTPIYSTGFDSTAELAQWRLEGGRRMVIEDGCLVLESAPGGAEPSPTDNHLVCWLKPEMPADFLLEFRVNPVDRRCGLNIVFFNTRGRGGEDIFDPILPARTGFFSEYHSGALNNYHISYWAGARGVANVRKNLGFHLVASGPDLIAPALAHRFQIIRVYKRGGSIRMTVDGILALSYDDNGLTHGPVIAHAGWIGLRQMGHTRRCQYDDLRVYPLKRSTTDQNPP